MHDRRQRQMCIRDRLGAYFHLLESTKDKKALSM
jgi:hypothetical protein